MKELYSSPAAELIVFAAMEKLATGGVIPFNEDDTVIEDGSQNVGRPPWAN